VLASIKSLGGKRRSNKIKIGTGTRQEAFHRIKKPLILEMSQ
jgi:hypothetical protein